MMRRAFAEQVDSSSTCQFVAGHNTIVADSRQILMRAPHTPLASALSRGEAVDLQTHDMDLALALVRHLEGSAITVSTLNARELRLIASRLGLFALKQRCERVIAAERHTTRHRFERSTSRVVQHASEKVTIGAEAALSSVNAWRLRRYGFKSQQIQTEIGRVHMLEARGQGTLPPIVVLHGLSAEAASYSPLLRHLTKISTRVLAPDLPGHGRSVTDVPSHMLSTAHLTEGLMEALDHVLGGSPAILFGNSLGGLAALRYAASRPQNVLGLVLASPGGAPMTDDETHLLLDTFRIDSKAEALTFIDRLCAQPRSSRHLLAYGVRAHFARQSLRGLIKNASSRDMLTAAEMDSIKAPTFILWPKQERILPAISLEFFRTHVPHARIDELNGLGHFPLMDDLVLFCDWVETCMRDIHRVNP